MIIKTSAFTYMAPDPLSTNRKEKVPKPEAYSLNRAFMHMMRVIQRKPAQLDDKFINVLV